MLTSFPGTKQKNHRFLEQKNYHKKKTSHFRNQNTKHLHVLPKKIMDLSHRVSELKTSICEISVWPLGCRVTSWRKVGP